MGDPASLNVAVSFTGLSLYEAECVLANMPPGSMAQVEVTKPAIGGKRWAVHVGGLSVLGAKDVTLATYAFVERAAAGEV